jgi:hypothetical protein
MDRSGPETAILTRRLFEADLPAIRELNRTHGDVMRKAKPATYDHAFEASLRSTYLSPTDGNGLLVGTFTGSRLDVLLSLYFWRGFPYFSIANLKTRPGIVNLFAGPSSALGSCVEAALQLVENRRTWRGYMIHALQRWPAHRVRRSLARAFPIVERYHYEIELFVPGRTRPPYAFAWELMGHQTWPQDLVIETMTLKQEHRMSLPPSVRRAA